MSSETYVGYDRLQYLDPNQAPQLAKDQPAIYLPSSSLSLGELAFSGTWTVHSQEATAGRAASINLAFAGQRRIPGNGWHRYHHRHQQRQAPSTVVVSGVPRLYTLFQASVDSEGILSMSFSPGLQAYDFTFG